MRNLKNKTLDESNNYMSCLTETNKIEPNLNSLDDFDDYNGTLYLTTASSRYPKTDFTMKQPDLFDELRNKDNEIELKNKHIKSNEKIISSYKKKVALLNEKLSNYEKTKIDLSIKNNLINDYEIENKNIKDELRYIKISYVAN